jgi:PAS domain S-box-containing protein
MTLRLAALFGLVASLILAWLGNTYYRIDAENDAALLRADNERVLHLASLALSESLTNIMSDLRFLSHDNDLNTYLKHETPAAAKALAREFAALITQKRDYDQIRVLGLDGKERVRVDHTPEGARVMPDDRLQNKRSRYYFSALEQLSGNEIYVSPLDLNEEYGQIEQPLKPMIRFGIAIHDPQGARRGYLLINYRAEPLLDKLRGLSVVSHGLWLLDAQGEWLAGANPNDAWSGQLPQRRDRGFARQHPAAWQAMRQAESGSVQLAAAQLRFLRIHPLISQADVTTPSRLAQPAAVQHYYWYAVVANQPLDMTAHHSRQSAVAIQGGIAIVFLVLLATTALAYAIARQRALTQSLEQAVDNVPVLIAYVDSNQRYRFNNRAYLDTYGISPMDLYGKHVSEIVGAASYRELQPRLERALQGERVEFEMHQDDRPGPRDLAVTFVPDGAVVIHGVYILTTDITQRRAAERREQEQQQEMLQVSRLASVGEITNEIAHQINQPLAAIAMFSNAAQRTLEKGGDVAKLRDWMETINAQAKRASEVVQRLRRFAYQGEIRSTALDLNGSLREAIGLVESEARARQVALDMELDEALPPVMAAAILMEQVIYNLLHNAIRSAADHGRQVMVRTLADSDRVWVEVRDRQDVGDPALDDFSIEPVAEQIDQAFGVGLSISRGIVTSYGGDILCRHNKDGGSQVSFYLPRLEP